MNVMLIIVSFVVLMGFYALFTKSLGVEPVELSIREDCRRLGLAITTAVLLGITLRTIDIHNFRDLKLALLVAGVGMLFLLLGNMRQKS